MGMHHGIVAARCEWSRMKPAMSWFVGSYKDHGPIQTIEDHHFEVNDGDILIAGEYKGNSFVLDKMMIQSCEFDRLAELSARVGTAVVAVAGETVSGTYSLCVAEGGSVRRVYHNCLASIQTPFTFGAPLPFESRVDLEDIDGNGLQAALQSYGLDYAGWFESGSKTLLAPSADEGFSEAAEGPLSTAMTAHFEQHKRARSGKEMWKTKVVTRRLPDGSTGFDIVPDLGKPGFFSRFMSHFRK